jgi:dTDP-4-amino-4,6-dideoxygalactose transaminase
MPVHLYGQCVDMNAVLEIARRYQLVVIEDACQSHGARYKGKQSGTLGNLGCFSFYPGKNLGAYGDGGAVVTNDKKLANKIRRLRNYGQRSKYDHQEKGSNARLDEMQAAVLNVKLKYLDEWNRLRAKHAFSYSENLKNIEQIKIPEIFSDRDPVFHLYVIRAKNRNELQRFLREKKIATQIHYPLPIHLEEAYKDLGHKAGDFPKTEQVANEILSLPMFPELQSVQRDYVIQAIQNFYSL